ncbi:MAG: maleylpyruvate isomerase [Actinomycetota bacterium]|nr:maleylpyruvate isomerase [Actinomycetota bacterium]
MGRSPRRGLTGGFAPGRSAPLSLPYARGVQSPATDVEEVGRATRQVLRALDDLTDEQAAAPSRLPGWTRAEVVTHLARNADGIRGMVEAATRGEVTSMYPGAEARVAGIAAGRGAAAAVLRADLRGAHERLVEAWNALPEDGWERLGRASVTRTIRDFIWVRRREVEVHHVDLDLGYEPSDWPVGFVSDALDEIFGSLVARGVPTRALIDVDYRVVSTDHDRAWRVEIRGTAVRVTEEDRTHGPADGEASGWGCDVAAWLYGRDPRGGGVLATGDIGVLRLPRWFPFA